MGTFALAQLSSSFALTSSLWRLKMSSTPNFSEDTGVLHLAVELFQRYIKRDMGVYDNLAHRAYQRDRLVSRRLWRGW